LSRSKNSALAGRTLGLPACEDRHDLVPLTLQSCASVELSLRSPFWSGALQGVRNSVGRARFKVMGENSSSENVSKTKFAGYQTKEQHHGRQ